MSCSLAVSSSMAAWDRAGTGLAQTSSQIQLSWHSSTTHPQPQRREGIARHPSGSLCAQKP